MTLLPSNLIIALAWATVAGEYSATNLLLGFGAGYIALYAFGEFYGGTRYHARTYAVLSLTLYFIWDLINSSLSVAQATITRSHLGRNRFVTMPLDVESDYGKMLTANLITLTPGTLSVDIDPEGKTLLIHAMFADDPDEVVKSLKDNIERRVIEVLR